MKKLVGAASHHEWEIEELREDREFAIEYLKVAFESLDNPEERAGGLLMLRAVVEAYGGLARWLRKPASAASPSIARSHPKGNPTLKTLIAVLKTLDLRLSIAPAHKKVARKSKRQQDDSAAA